MSDTDANPLPFGWTEHVNRRLIHAETHARPVPPLAGPATIRRVAFISADRGSDLALLQSQMAELAKIPGNDLGSARQLEFKREGHNVIWEMHNEFATLTWKSPLGDTNPWPRDIGLELHGNVALVSATRVDVIDDDLIDPARLAQLAENSLCHSGIYAGRARIATDFVPDADRFGFALSSRTSARIWSSSSRSSIPAPVAALVAIIAVSPPHFSAIRLYFESCCMTLSGLAPSRFGSPAVIGLYSSSQKFTR